MEKVERTLSDVESDLSQEPEPAGEKPTPAKKVKKVAKKAKKVAKKAAKPEKTSDEGKVTLADLASEAQITAAAARRRLREAEMSPEGRWKWDEGSKALKEARKVLGLDG